jgi:hypothetical protein
VSNTRAALPELRTRFAFEVAPSAFGGKGLWRSFECREEARPKNFFQLDKNQGLKEKRSIVDFKQEKSMESLPQSFFID